MVIVARVVQALLVLFAAAVTAFAIGLATYDDVGDRCSRAQRDGQ